MDQVKDGGPAFPVSEEAIMRNAVGMNLRDYFAAKAMAGFCASFVNVAHKDQSQFLEGIGRIAYEVADAMLKAREKTNG